MRKVIFAMSVSVDGFIETASGDINWTSPDPELQRHMIDRENIIDTHLYGRRLYETMVAYWPTADKNPSASRFDIEYARVWKEKRKIVFSKTLTQVGGSCQLFRGNISEEINKLKTQPGKDMFVGGPHLASTFMKLGLIDEYWLYVCPTILGSGKPMFADPGKRIDLKLIGTNSFGSGVVLLKLANKGAADR
ncbi:MAG TPA: dihydrofolate reductase family protein [Anaerolineales bacterium]|nr:dihydrofolate reductase family protein [Anaerolineales bacterium]